MINDYTGTVLHDARQRDLVNEAKGGWLLKQARDSEPASEQHSLMQRGWPLVLIAITLAIGVLTH
jgi:hypothetical protein